MDVVFETDPSDEGGAEDEIKESFVGYGEDDEDWGEGQEDDDEAVEVVIIGLKTMEEGDGKRCNFFARVSVFNPEKVGTVCSILRTSQPMT